MKSATMNPSFGEKHKEYIQNAVRCTISVAEGAVRAGKTIDNIAAFATMIQKGTPEHLKNRTLSKPERIKAMIDQKVGKITKKEIMDAHPDISKTTVERTLADLVKSEYIAKVGSGPATGYVKI